MSFKQFILTGFSILLFLVAVFIYVKKISPPLSLSPSAFPSGTENLGGPVEKPNPLSISYLRDKEYPGSQISIEENLPDGSNYKRYIASYKSEDFKIYALLTVPKGEKPTHGWPVIIFNHGYIPPNQYKTAERYIAYTDAFSRSGYIVFKSDYRGHGESEGNPSGPYGSNDYTIDVLNALSSLKKYPDADSSRIGMWGHSMGGFITLRTMVVSKDIKAGVIWGGVVAPYEDILFNWRRKTPFPTNPNPTVRSWRVNLINQYGSPSANPTFWNSLSANSYLSDISGPIQLDHSVTDEEVPYAFSEKLDQELKAAGKTVEFYSYEGDDHNISHNLNTALNRSVAFFDKYVKNTSE